MERNWFRLIGGRIFYFWLFNRGLALQSETFLRLENRSFRRALRVKNCLLFFFIEKYTQILCLFVCIRVEFVSFTFSF